MTVRDANKDDISRIPNMQNMSTTVYIWGFAGFVYESSFSGFYRLFFFFCGDHLSYFTLNLIWKKTLVGEWTIDVELLLAMPVVEWMQQ